MKLGMRPLGALVFALALILLGGCATGKYIPTPNEELYGTWTKVSRCVFQFSRNTCSILEEAAMSNRFKTTGNEQMFVFLTGCPIYKCSSFKRRTWRETTEWHRSCRIVMQDQFVEPRMI